MPKMRTLKVSEKVYNQYVNKGFYNGRTRLYRIPKEGKYRYLGEDVAEVTDYDHNFLFIAQLTIQ
jgi:hypothetical protein